jgi:hypothetical protein
MTVFSVRSITAPESAIHRPFTFGGESGSSWSIFPDKDLRTDPVSDMEIFDPVMDPIKLQVAMEEDKHIQRKTLRIPRNSEACD